MNENMIFIMCDDLGYGDTGFNGNQIIKTPCLDNLAREGASFSQFYSGAPVCSPTRGTCLTGRHHFRYGITHANEGILPKEEITLQEILKEKGYTTGHFGKWHLGTLSKEIKDGRRGGSSNPKLYSPPWEHNFDECFSTEVAVPLWNPMKNQTFDSKYWTGEGEFETQNLEGDDSRIIMDRAIPFIEHATKNKEPFLAVIWFHAPHTPVLAGPEYKKIYEQYPENMQHYFGCVTAMDEQIGRLNETIKNLGIEENTCMWFCSDNGPEGDGTNKNNNCGSTRGLKGRKRSLFNGGINVPAVIKWPKHIKPETHIEFPSSTLDYVPTIIEETGYKMPDERPIDGISLIGMFRGDIKEREKPIPFRFVDKKEAMFGSPTFVLIGNDYKVLTNMNSNIEEDMIFDIKKDKFEQYNLQSTQNEKISEAKKYLSVLLKCFQESHNGKDYNNPEFRPVREYISNEENWLD